MKRLDRTLIGLAVAMLLTVPAAAQKVSHDASPKRTSGHEDFRLQGQPGYRQHSGQEHI
jgi:hypothetical protein